MSDSPFLYDSGTTVIVPAACRGDEDAVAQLYRRWSARMRAFAVRILTQHRHDPFVQATEIVDRAFLRVLRQAGSTRFAHEDAAALKDCLRRLWMRRIENVAIDLARLRNAKKRTPPANRQPLDELPGTGCPATPLLLEEAMARFREIKPLHAELVERLCIRGEKLADVAGELDLQPDTIKKYVRVAATWFRKELSANPR